MNDMKGKFNKDIEIYTSNKKLSSKAVWEEIKWETDYQALKIR
jgi:hypothetical protein